MSNSQQRRPDEVLAHMVVSMCRRCKERKCEWSDGYVPRHKNPSHYKRMYRPCDASFAWSAAKHFGLLDEVKCIVMGEAVPQ